MPVSISSSHWVDGAADVNLGTTGNAMVPTRIVVHYSAGSTLSGAVTTLIAKKLSYNIMVDTDGSFHQTRPLNRSSSHAGRSN